MAKRESTLLNMVLTLFFVSAAASAALGYIYTLTSGPIEAARVAKRNAAISMVIPEYNNTPVEDMYKAAVEGDTLYFYPGKKDGELVGTAVETFTKKGFSGYIRLMVGLLPDGTINDIVVLEHKETPGLGDKIEQKKSFNKKTGKSWSTQFMGKHPEQFRLTVVKDGGEVDAITASTITSRAYCDAVVRAYETYSKGGDQ